MKLLLTLIFTLLMFDINLTQAATANIDVTVTHGGTSNEKFVGPFPSWMCVRSLASGTCGTAAAAYGTATGDGSTNDASAIQTMLNKLGFGSSCAAGSGCVPVLYFPAGTYKVNSTLTLSDQLYIAIIGADPDTTSILWGGGASGTMLSLNGNAYSRFNRITFNGANTAGVLIEQAWDGSGGNFDTGNEYADDVFKNAQIGIRCGNLGHGCAETSMLRGRFLDNTTSGIRMRNANALDMFVWYSVFDGNQAGIDNDPDNNGAGNFHIFNSIFLNENIDVWVGNTGVFNLVDSYLNGATFASVYMSNNSAPNPLIMRGNTIVDPVNTIAVHVGDFGPLLLIDNTIASLSGATTGPVVEAVGGGADTNLFSIGNTFTVGSSVSCAGGSTSPISSAGHCHTVQDQIVSRASLNPVVPTLPGVPPNDSVTIFEATSGGSGTTCSIASPCSATQAIANAVTAGSRAVAHLQPGTHTITSTITMPANSDIQVIGDGLSSILSASGASPVLRLNGPSKVTLRNFQVKGNAYASDGVEVNTVDQVGSRVFMQNPVISDSRTHLLVDALDRTNVELHDINVVYGADTGVSQPAIVVTGGPLASAGNWAGGATNIFSGSTTGNYSNYSISGGAHVFINAIWNEDSDQRSLTATGQYTTVTYAGGNIALSGLASESVLLNNFRGTAALMNLLSVYANGSLGKFSITGTGTDANVLALGLTGAVSTTVFSDTSSGTTTEYLNGLFIDNTGAGSQATEVPSSPNTSFVTTTLKQFRKSLPSVPVDTPLGITDVRFHGINVNNANVGIHLKN